MADTNEDHELTAATVGGAGINDDDHDDVSNNAVDLQALPPADRGKAAWLTLAACFVLEASVWGYAGQSTHPPLSSSIFIESK